MNPSVATFTVTHRVFPCPTCAGRGSVGTQRETPARCPECRGRGSVLWVAGRQLTWDRAFDSWRLLEHRLERGITLVLNGALLLFGTLGLLSLGKTVADLTQAGESVVGAFGVRSGPMALFSVSVLTDLYFVYRLLREQRGRSTVLRRYRVESGPTVVPAGVDWDELVRNPKAAEDASRAFTAASGSVLDGAFRLARQFSHTTLEPLHLFAALLASRDVQTVLGRLGLPATTLRDRLAASFTRLPQGKADPEQSAGFRQAALFAYVSAHERRSKTVEPLDLLLGVAAFENPAQTILFDLDVEFRKLRNVTQWVDLQRQLARRFRSWRSRAATKPKGVMNRSMTAVATPNLDRVGRDLTQLARAGVLVPVVDREKEIEAIFRILEGGKSVLLVGNPGVGKSALVEGLAARMASEDVPAILEDKRLVSLSVATLVGSAGRTGELEERVLTIVNEIVRAGNILLVIDNVQNLVGLTTEGAQRLDLADVFTQLLQGGALLALATTNPIDYRRYVERSSLASTFTPVTVDEVDEEGAILILESKAPLIEAKHEVFFSYDAIEKTVQFAIRYLHERYLPEKAITLLEEVAVAVKKGKGKGAVVSGEDVAEIVAEKTNVPVTRVTEQETQKLLHLEDRMHQRIVGQDEAVKAVAAALRRARAELRDVKRPIANLLFLGPTGVGKTELAKTVAEVYFGREDAMIRLDMSEYQDAASIYKLIGAPPGLGTGLEGGFLTEAVRKNPFTLLLLDELEKAHPDILNVFLQVMDDGRLTDGVGRTIDFTNIILIATSNAGTQFLQEGIRAGQTLQALKQQMLERILLQYFRPEFLNRFDAIILFKPLTMDEVKLIVRLLLKKDSERLALKGISLRVADAAVDELAAIGYDPIYGARPLRRAIQEHVDNALANFLLSGSLGRRDVAVLEAGGVIRVERAGPV